MDTLDFNDIPALIPTRKRETTIISNDLEALLLTAKRAPVMRKRLFNNRQFFLWMRERVSSTADNSALYQKSTHMVLNLKYQSPLRLNFRLSMAERHY